MNTVSKFAADFAADQYAKLLAERDALQAKVHAQRSLLTNVITERDAARAQVFVLKDALYEVANVSLQTSDRAELKRAVKAARAALAKVQS
jgi:uncharacterized coiled-coil DUF342 family protein